MKLIQMPFLGIALLLLVANKNSAQPDRSLTLSDKSEIVKTAIHLQYENYIFPERVENIESYVQDKLKHGQYDSLQTYETFLESLNNDFHLQGHDTHLDISYGPDRVKQIRLDNQHYDADIKEEISAGFLAKMQYENFRLRKLERLDGNVGYFNFLSFAPLGPAKESITSAMNFLLYSDAIIIDLREIWN
ncbi:MAG TPA: hypothetical protein VFG10_08130 [Saprospiraceae bacterium]|nr:hypothetical protein [Saprospiraceae bacterium]